MTNNNIEPPPKIALIVVDYQVDFISGSLALKNGTAGEDAMDALPHINALLKKHESVNLVVYTRDMHPANHISFFSAASHEDREVLDAYKQLEIKLFDTVEFKNKITPQTLYPAHCIVGTPGAAYHPEMIQVPNAIHIDKGVHHMVESYSAFRDNDKQVHTSLEKILRSAEIDTLIICGIAYDICVFHTAMDAVEFGFRTAVAYEACKGLDKEGIIAANEEFEKHAIVKLTTEESLKLIEGKFLPPERE